MSSGPIRHPSRPSLAEAPPARKPVASVSEAPRGDFVSIHSRAVLLDKLEEIANLANEATGADGVAIALREDDQYLCRASLGFAPEIGVAVEPGQGVCGQCVAESRLILAQDLPGEVKSALAAPVVVAGKVQGLIATFSFRAGAFAASHSDLLCCLASDIAQGLDSLESIHLVTPETITFAAETDHQPISRDQHLAIIEAVTAPVLSVTPSAPETSSAAVAATDKRGIEPEPSGAPNSGFHFFGYNTDSQIAVYDFDENATSPRPFRHHWDIIVILAAVLIAVLTFGVWLRHRRNEPYTGSLGRKPLPTFGMNAHHAVATSSTAVHGNFSHDIL